MATKNTTKKTIRNKFSARVAEMTETAYIVELEMLAAAVKQEIANRKAAIKVERIAQIKAEMGEAEGKQVTVKAPASSGLGWITGIVKQARDNTFTVTTTDILSPNGKPKNLSRSYVDFVSFGDTTADYQPDDVSDDVDADDADEMAV